MSSGATRRRGPARQDGYGRAGTAILVTGVMVVGVLLGLAVAGGLGSGRGPKPTASGGGPAPAETTSTAPAAVTTTTSRQEALDHLLSLVTTDPVDGGTAKAGGTVIVQASGARLDSVVLKVAGGPGTTTSSSSPARAEVAGQIATSGSSWHSTGLLVPSTVYSIRYRVSGTDGLTAVGTGTFHTAAPPRPVSVSIWPVPGLSVGVGEPIELTFSQPLSDAAQKAVLARITVDMSDPVPGGWHWFSPTSLHFRPTAYWPSGEQVQATVDLANWDIGDGEWGVGTAQSQFVVGAARISVVNLTTHEMTVTQDGQVIYEWPISAGAPRWPTQDGVHIVLDRSSRVQMISSSVGIPVHSAAGYDETVYWDTQISYSGEYVHAAPWSLSEQGIENVSHGCVNVSPADAEAFFHFSRVGDVVDVIGGTRPPLATDGGVMDWSFGPAEVAWTPAKVGLLATTVTTLPTTTEPPPAGAPTTSAPVPTVPPGSVALPPQATPTPLTTVPATTVPATTVPATTVPATTVPAAPATTSAPVTTAGASTTTAAPVAPVAARAATPAVGA